MQIVFAKKCRFIGDKCKNYIAGAKTQTYSHTKQTDIYPNRLIPIPVLKPNRKEPKLKQAINGEKGASSKRQINEDGIFEVGESYLVMRPRY